MGSYLLLIALMLLALDHWVWFPFWPGRQATWKHLEHAVTPAGVLPATLPAEARP